MGDRSDSSTYVRMKLKAAVEANIDCELVQLPEDTSESDLLHRVYQYNNDPSKVSQHHAKQKEEMGLQGINVAYNPNYIVSMVVEKGS